MRKHKVGDRVVVTSFIACGRCWYCEQQLYSLCDNGNPNPAINEALWGYSPGGCFGYSHAMGGFAGSHADYVRVPFGDYGAFTIPDEVDDMTALFASDAVATGWTGADLIGVQPGDVVAVWGAGAVGQMAARAAQLKGAERVIVIDRLPERLTQAANIIGTDTINYETDRGVAVREAVHACRKGGGVFVLGVYGGLVDKFPLGAVMNKGLTLRGAQMHGQRYVPEILELMARGEVKTAHLATHVMPLDQGPEGYHWCGEGLV